jgi:hypothetical protein
MSPDPYGGFDPTNPASFNRYVYTLGDPVNLHDAQGLLADPADGFCPAEFADCGQWDWLRGPGYEGTGGMPTVPCMAPTGFTRIPGTFCFIVPMLAAASTREPAVTDLVVADDCWSNTPNNKSGAPYRKTKFVAYNGNRSLEGDPRITIQEWVVNANGQLATNIIQDPNSKGDHGVFNDEKGLSFKDLGPVMLFQYFKVSISGGPQFTVPVRNLGTTLGLFFTWYYASPLDWVTGNKDFNVFIQGNGKGSIRECGK